MANLITVFQGDILTGTVALRTIDQTNPDNQNPFPIPSGGYVEMYFPGTLSSVVISSQTTLPSPLTGQEIVVTDAALGDLSYTVVPAKTSLMKLGVAQAVDVIVYDANGNPLTFEIIATITVQTRLNP